MSCVRGRAADPQLAVRGAGRALADRGGQGAEANLGGRRRAGYFYRDPKAPPPEPDQPRAASGRSSSSSTCIRERLAQWREAGYPGATRTTLDLIRHWRREGREQRLFFAQLEAAETIIFLTEARSDLLQGIDVPPEVRARTGVEPSRATPARWRPARARRP